MTHVTFVHGIGNKPEPRALLDLWRRKLAQGAGAIDLGDAGVESTMVYWTDVLYERPNPDLAAFERGAGDGGAKSPEVIMGFVSESQIRTGLAAGGRRIRTRGPSGKGKAMRSHSMQASLSRVSSCRFLCESSRRFPRSPSRALPSR